MTVEHPDIDAQLDGILGMALDERPKPLIALARTLLEQDQAAVRPKVAQALAGLVEEGVGDRAERLEMGEVLGWLGDPRLRMPQDSDYWVDVTVDEGPMQVGRFQVTTAEFRRFVDAGGYSDSAWWSDMGWQWLQGCEEPWPTKSTPVEVRPFAVPNQPVVGVSWYEAEAYARWVGARLLRFDERLQIVRGPEKRPYPWGSPFCDGCANTREEVLGRPCAVGLYICDRTPDGVRDLAGNAGEWTADGVGEDRWVHPGSWHQPSMAAWAKARELESPTHRSGGLGFRLIRQPV